MHGLGGNGCMAYLCTTVHMPMCMCFVSLKRGKVTHIWESCVSLMGSFKHLLYVTLTFWHMGGRLVHEIE